jgi:ATP-dependent DNA helicase RecG
MFEAAARFLRIHLPARHPIEGYLPETFPELPEVALRETLVNALAHRDYTVPGPIRVLIFDDRVEVRAPGQLSNTVTVEAIKLGGAHVLRNPMLYLLFSRFGLVTGLGSGVFRVFHLVTLRLR